MSWVKMTGELCHHASSSRNLYQSEWLGWDGWVNISQQDCFLLSEEHQTTATKHRH